MPEREGRRTVAWVKWFDASYQRGECTREELVPRVEIESAGLLIHEDEDSVSLALDHYEADGTWRHIEHIPKVNVRRIRRLTF
jgi:hypothetical protein